MPGNRYVSREKLLSLREEIKNHGIAQDEKVKEAVLELEAHMDTVEELDINDKFLIFAALAKYFRTMNHYDKCGSYSRKGINLAKRIDEAHTGVLIDTYLDYAGLERDYGQLADARILLAKLLQLLETKKWADPSAFALTYSNLGKVYLDEENTQLGIFQLEKALDYFRKSSAATDPIIIETIQAITDASIQMESYDRALSLNQELLKIQQRENDRLSEAKTLMKIGEIYYYIDLRKAKVTITEALHLFKTEYEEKHLDIAKAYLMLAELEENVGEFTEAISCYQKSLFQLVDIYKADHFLIVYNYSKLGSLSLQINEQGMAKDYLEKGLSLANDFPKIRLQFLMGLGKVYSNLEMHEAAISMYQEFLQFLEKDKRKKTKGYADTLQAIAFNFMKVNNLEDAVDYYLEALDGYGKLTRNCDSEKGLIHIRLAHCFENKQDIDEAMFHMEKGISLLEKNRDQHLLNEFLQEAIDFFNRYGSEEKRSEYEAKYAQLQAVNG